MADRLDTGHPSHHSNTEDGGEVNALSADVVGILDTVDVPIMVISHECTLARYNRAATETFGVTAWDIGRPLSDITALSDAKDLGKYCAQVMADDVPIRRDLASGDRRFLLRIAPYTPNSGRSAGAVLTFTNVTAFRASLDQALHEREYTKAILNTVSNPLVVLDAELRVQSANRAFYEMFAVSRENAQNAALSTLGNDDWNGSGLWAALTAIVGDDKDFEVREIAREFPTLGLRTVLLDARRLSSTGNPTILLAFHDITERKRVEAALLESERRFREMVDALPVAVYTTDAEGRLTHFNPAAAEFAGRTPELGIDQWCVTWKLYFPDGRPMPHEEAPMAIALKEMRKVRGLQAIAERPDGERRWFEPYLTPLFDASGRLSGAINMLLDITERKRADEALQEADRRKDEFLALLAHELRNPLAPIRTGLELIRISGDTPHSVRRVRAMMERQVSQMVRLIDDLLDVSRIASGKIVLQRAPTSVSELVHSAIEAHRTAIEAAKIELIVDLPAQPCVIDVDSTRFVQVLSNLLHNASKFTPAQGTIRIGVEPRGADDVPQVAITVSDTGVGISQELLPRIFELFVQAESATERTHGGLGIGLALSRRLIEMHGGRIAAHSDGPGQGTALVITMPVCQADATRPSPSPIEVSHVASRVVIIDDNQDAAHTMSMLVEQLGGSARMAHDPLSGLAAVQEFHPDMVFLDIGMPGMDGYETCRRIRRQPSRRHIVIVAVTGWGQPQDKQRALDAGFDAHLTKPVDPTAFARVLAMAAEDPEADPIA
jgi:PAS domain S-box-containing protein